MNRILGACLERILRAPVWIGGLVAGGIVIAGHLTVGATGAAYQGAWLPFDRIYDVGCAAGILLLAWGLGSVVVDRLPLPGSTATERLLFSTALGIGCEGMAVLGLGAVPLLHGWALGAMALIAAWIARDPLSRLPRKLREVADDLDNGLDSWALWILGFVALFLVLQSATPPGDWDVLTYHLDVPREYLDAGRIFLPEDNHHAAFVGLQHMLYIPLLALGAETAPAIVSATIALLLGLSMYAAGSRLFDRTTGNLAAILLWGSPVLVLVGVTARVDVTMTWLLVLAHFAVLVSLERRSIDEWFWVAAIVAGLAVATKFSALAYVAALFPVVVWVAVQNRRDLRQQTAAVTTFGVLTTAIAVPWMLKNLILLGAPFYPYLAEISLEPWLADYLGRSTIPEGLDPEAFRLTKEIREPFSLVALFSDPGSMTDEHEGAFYFGNFVLLLLPLSVVWLRRKLVALLLPALLFVGIVLYPDARVNLRYLTPALVIGTLAASDVVGRVGTLMVSKRRLRRTLWAGVLVLSLAPTVTAMYHALSEMRPDRYWLGRVSGQEYLTNNSNPDVYLNAIAREHLNERVTANARVVMLFESRGYGYRPEVLQDNMATTWRVLAKAAPSRDCLQSTGATHVLVNYGHFGSLVQRGLDLTTTGWSSFARFGRNCLRKEGMLARNVVLYRIAGPLGSDGSELGPASGSRRRDP